MRTNPFLTKHRIRPTTGFLIQWRMGLAPLLVSLTLALALTLGSTPAAYALPAPSSDIIITIAGTPGVSGYAGDGGPATAAQLDYPTGAGDFRWFQPQTGSALGVRAFQHSAGRNG